MNVPNKELKAFKDMTTEEMGVISAAIIAGNIEYWSSYSKKWMIPGRAMGGIDFEAAYRTRQRQLVIPWDVIKPEYKWASMDEDGGVWFFCEKPGIDGDDKYWGGCKDFCQSPLNIDTTGIDWRESLVQRPE